MSASSDGSNSRSCFRLDPMVPRSSHAQLAFEECIEQQVVEAEKAAAEKERSAAQNVAVCIGWDPSHNSAIRKKVTPNYGDIDRLVSCYENTNLKEKKTGQKSKNVYKSRSRSGRRRRRPNILLVNTSKAKSSAEVIRVSLNELGWRWREYSGNQRASCDLYWNGIAFSDCDSKPLGGMVNKFPGLLELVRKAQLSKLLHQMRQLFPEEYDFYPRTWILPEQYHVFCAEVATFIQKHPNVKPVFIVKPDDGCQGDGIYLINNPHHMSSMGLIKPAIVQEYVPRPLLLERLKFDLRVYVLLASINPLRIYISKEGMARFCTVPYQEPTNRNLHVTYMHLTNYSLNKYNSQGFVHADATDRGSKRTMSSVLGLLAERGLDTPRLWEEIQELVVKTITAMLPDLRVVWEAEFPPKRSNPSCFQILGFDILLTSKLKPILLEVNSNPSLRLDFENHLPNGLVETLPSPVDEEIKIPLVTDILRLIRPGKRSRAVRSATARRHQIPVVSLDRRQDRVGEEDSEAAVAKGTGSCEDVPAYGGRGDEVEEEGEVDEEVEEDPLHDSVLQEIWPRKFGCEYAHLRIMERVAALYNFFLGVRGAQRMGATGFRTFCRKCKLCGSMFSTAAADIMYIDIARRWNEPNCEGVAAGMCFGAFLEAFFALAKRRACGDTLSERVLALVEHCERNINSAPHWPRRVQTQHRQRQRQQQQSVQRRLTRPAMAAHSLSRKNNSEN